jgi:hypothetical protein
MPGGLRKAPAKKTGRPVRFVLFQQTLWAEQPLNRRGTTDVFNVDASLEIEINWQSEREGQSG